MLASIVSGRNSAVYTYVFMDLDVASLGDDVMNVHGLTLFKFVRNVSQDVQPSLHGIKIVWLSLMASR